MGVSKNRGKNPKSYMFIGFSIIFTIHFWGFTPIFGNTHPVDIPLNPGWLIGILVMAYYNPYITG